MRIISKFKDYYDSAAGLGFDPDRLYRRDTEVIEVKSNSLPISQQIVPLGKGHLARYRDEAPARSLTIGFCGKFHPAWVEPTFEPNVNNFSAHLTQKEWLSFEEVYSAAEVIAHEYGADRWRRYWYVSALRDLLEHQKAVTSAPEDVHLFQTL